ncbi:MAG: porin [Pseudomonadota bacterium]
MNKYLLGGAAIAGLMLASAPAQAQLELTIGGHTKNYMGYLNQDDSAGVDTRNFDIQRETELHVNGEATLDNGMTFGFQIETEMDVDDDSNTVEESYIYMSGAWGRVNIGSENGAAYLLQVAAPSADSNIDGLRQYIQPVNYANTDIAGAFTGATSGIAGRVGLTGNTSTVDGFDYDNDMSGFSEKITYLSPNWNGLQVGLSYTPEHGDTGSIDPILNGFSTDDSVGDYGTVVEGGIRYEGVWSNFGYAIGGGYTQAEVEQDSAVAGAANDDYTEWNLAVDVDSGPFGIGTSYTDIERSVVGAGEDVRTWVLGADYTTGPFKFGASYFMQDDETAGAAELDTERYTGGVIYTAGPGLSFRGSLSYIDHDAGANDADATSLMGGVQINF